MVRTKFRGPLVASAIVAIALLVAVRFDAFEGFLAWTRRYDGWQAGGLLLLLFLAVAFACYYWRGHGELHRIRDLYEGLLVAQSELGEGLVVVEDGRVRYANDAFCEISGYGMEELEALPSLMQLLVPQEERDSVLGRLDGDEGNTYYDTTLRRKDGRPVQSRSERRTWGVRQRRRGWRGKGNDQMRSYSGNDRVYGEAGNDGISAVDGVEGNDVADGGPGESDYCSADPRDKNVACELP